MFNRTRNKGTKSHTDTERQNRRKYNDSASSALEESDYDVPLTQKQRSAIKDRCQTCNARGAQGGVLDISGLNLNSSNINDLIDHIETNLRNQPRVKVLFLSNNSLTKFPTEITNSIAFSDLTYCDLSNNQIKASYGTFTNYEELDGNNDDSDDDNVYSSDRDISRSSLTDRSSYNGSQSDGLDISDDESSQTSKRKNKKKGKKEIYLDEQDIVENVKKGKSKGSSKSRQPSSQANTKNVPELPKQISKLKNLILLDLQGNPGYTSSGKNAASNISIAPSLQVPLQSRKLTILIGDDSGKVFEDSYEQYVSSEEEDSNIDDEDDSKWRDEYYSTDDEGDVDNFYSNDGIGGRVDDHDSDGTSSDGSITERDIEDLSRRMKKQLTFTVENRRSLLEEGLFRDIENSNAIYLIDGDEALPWKLQEKYEKQWDNLENIEFIRYIIKRYSDKNEVETVKPRSRSQLRIKKKDQHIAREDKDRNLRNNRKESRKTKQLQNSKYV